MKLANAEIVRRIIARQMLSGLEAGRLGRIELYAHQRSGAARVLQSLDEFGGALLCDAVGLGKTYTATAVIRRFDSSIIIAPAALVPMWSDVLKRTGLSADIKSLETFSRTEVTPCNAGLVVIDEAHHLRNSATLRFRNIAAFVTRSRVLLLTATPVHNRKSDLTTLISLFLGSSAESIATAELARCIIRRSDLQAGVMKVPRRLQFADKSCPLSPVIRQMILDLPPPVPARDGEYCATLVQFTLLRQWASSDAALKAGLKTRIGKARALISALEAGTYPTRKELSAWLTADGDVQLAFPTLIAALGGDADLLAAVSQHEEATIRLLDKVSGTESADVWRADYVRGLRSRYSSRKIVVFTQFAATARTLFRMLKVDPKVGLVTSGGCEIASGRVGREYVLSHFAPAGNGSLSPAEREEITLLVATDLCSEGLNLQDAGVVVHLDLPWTRARLEQRIGRIARAESLHQEVFVHTLSVPVVSDDILRIGERLRRKALLSDLLIGSGEPVKAESRELSIPESTEVIQSTLALWDVPSPPSGPEDLTVAFVRASEECFLGLVTILDRCILVAGANGRVTDDPRIVAEVMRSLLADDIEADTDAVCTLIAAIRQWSEQHILAETLGVAAGSGGARRRVTGHIDRFTVTRPRHSRPKSAAIADSARRTLNVRTNAGTEMRLRSLESQPGSEEWVRSLVSLAELSPMKKTGPNVESGLKLIALLAGRKNGSVRLR
jgi:superfamily II DNA or RNA helicase